MRIGSDNSLRDRVDKLEGATDYLLCRVDGDGWNESINDRIRHAEGLAMEALNLAQESTSKHRRLKVTVTKGRHEVVIESRF